MLRTLFEEEFARLASGKFGFHIESRAMAEIDGLAKQLVGHVEPLEALSLSATHRRERDELLGALAYLVGEGYGGGQAVVNLVRESTVTAVNRLLAVRVAEAIGTLPAALSRGRQSSGYRDMAWDLFPLLGQQEGEGFWTYLQVCGDELGASVPLLFDRRLPISAFVPSRATLDAAVDVINDAAVAPVWEDPEALGWAYQFFNSEEERKAMRESQSPSNWRELAVRNQFFTPRYVVDWLVQNSLGRRLRQAGYGVELPLLTGDDPADRSPLALDDVRILDPAVGSGHFLLGCYDLLERAWRTIGVEPAEAAPRILRSLHGIEIDPRAAQVSQAVLLLRARRAAPGVLLSPPAVATARGLPSDQTVRDQVFAELGPSARELALDIAEALDQAPELGSLLKVESRLQEGATTVARTQPRLGDRAEATVEELEEEILTSLRQVTAHAGASPVLRMFAADAADAIRFVEICQQRYDTVLMNPPFGDPIDSTREYLRAAYGRSARDMYAAFVVRGIEFLREYGCVGAITSRSGFFLTTFSRWRSEVVLPRLLALLDLGQGVMHSAMVEAAAYVLGARPHHGEAVFRRLLEVEDKAAHAYAPAGHETFMRRPDVFAGIPGAPAAYWLDPALREVFEAHASIGESSTADVRQGLATADDFRFLRLWWEVPASDIGRSRRWVPFAKGGDYSPYYSDLHLVVDWEDGGRRLKDFDGSVIRNPDHYFRPGLTWSRRTQKGFSVRPVPADAIFGDKGPMVFVHDDDPQRLDGLMAYLNSSLTATLLEALVSFGSYEVGAVQRLPHVQVGTETAEVARTLTELRQVGAQRDETDHLFVSPWDVSGNVHSSLADMSRKIDTGAAAAAGVRYDAAPLSAAYPTQWFESEDARAGEPEPVDEVSYLLGAAFGRWDVRIAAGTADPPPMPGPYEPVPAASRGMLVDASGLPVEKAPVGYPLDIPADRVLYDDPGHPADVVRGIEAAAEVIARGTSGPGELLYQRRLHDLRAYLRDKFFSAHVTRYSVSGRSAPIYWHLTVPSKKWGLWVYAPSLSRETLFAVTGAASDQLRRLNEQLQQLRKQVGNDSGRSARQRVETLETLASEVEIFAGTADAVAQSGWEPDLSDGLVLCAAPLEGLFVERGWRREIAKHREKLTNGAYPWASVQRTYFRSRR